MEVPIISPETSHFKLTSHSKYTLEFLIITFYSLDYTSLRLLFLPENMPYQDLP